MNKFKELSRRAHDRWARGLSRRVFLSLPVILAATRARAAGPIEVGTVSRLVGTPSIMRGGRNLPAVRGMMLREGDKVITGSGGRLEITSTEGTVIVVGEVTTVVLTRFVAPSDAGPGTGLLDLIEGILRLQLPHSWNRFEVTTATAVASVRSTEWMIEGSAARSSVFVAKGRVEVENRARTAAVLLDPGFGTDVPAGGLPGTPKRWGQARIDEDLARTRIP